MIKLTIFLALTVLCLSFLNLEAARTTRTNRQRRRRGRALQMGMDATDAPTMTPAPTEAPDVEETEEPAAEETEEPTPVPEEPEGEFNLYIENSGSSCPNLTRVVAFVLPQNLKSPTRVLEVQASPMSPPSRMQPRSRP